MNELPNKAGRYHVARHIMLYVPPLGRPWFNITVSYTRSEHEQKLIKKLYINVNADFNEQVEDAKREASMMYSEVRKRAELYAKALLETLQHQKQLEMREKEDAKTARTEMLRLTARGDVQRVWARYGPTINMREPFFIYQWI